MPSCRPLWVSGAPPPTSVSTQTARRRQASRAPSPAASVRAPTSNRGTRPWWGKFAASSRLSSIPLRAALAATSCGPTRLPALGASRPGFARDSSPLLLRIADIQGNARDKVQQAFLPLLLHHPHSITLSWHHPHLMTPSHNLPRPAMLLPRPRHRHTPTHHPHHLTMPSYHLHPLKTSWHHLLRLRMLSRHRRRPTTPTHHLLRPKMPSP